MPVIFITDALVFLLLTMICGFIIYARQHEHLRAPWREVAKRPLAMSAAVVLMLYIAIGILDSLHFHPKLDEPDKNGNSVYSTEIISVLDKLLVNLIESTESTYSAPFSAYAYVKESIETEDGNKIRDYPRLKYAGAHLINPEQERTPDIVFRTTLGAVIGLLFSCFIFLIFIILQARRLHVNIMTIAKRIYSNKFDVPWYAVLLTIAVLIVVFNIIFQLSGHYHVLGTDKVGQDVMYQAIKSIRTGLVIGTLTTLVMLPFAILMGLMAGYFRGWVDDVIQYIYTTLNSIPGVLLIAASILLLQVYMTKHEADFTSLAERADLRLLFLCIILGIMSWTGLCRMLRAETLKLREMDYVQAAQAFGVGNFSIMMRHLLPNVMHIVMISIVLDFSGLVLAEAVLSYINIGVDPSMNSWGNMINSARLEMAREPVVWWSLAAAFVFMFLLVLAANLFSDAVRDAFDPRLRGI